MTHTDHLIRLDDGDIAEAVRLGIAESMPYGDLILSAIADGIAAATVTLLPHGAHLAVERGTEQGVGVVGIRVGIADVKALTQRGDWVRITDSVHLHPKHAGTCANAGG